MRRVSGINAIRYVQSQKIRKPKAIGREETRRPKDLI